MWASEEPGASARARRKEASTVSAGSLGKVRGEPNRPVDHGQGPAEGLVAGVLSPVPVVPPECVGQGQGRERRREVGVQLESPGVRVDGCRQIGLFPRMGQIAGVEVQLVCLWIARPGVGRFGHGPAKGGLHGCRDPVRDLVLQGEEVGQLEIPIFRPDVTVGIRLDDLCDHAHHGVEVLDRALEHVVCAQRVRDLARGQAQVPDCKDGRAGRRIQPRNLVQMRENLIMNGVRHAQRIVGWRQLFEGEHGDADFSVVHGRRQPGWRRGRGLDRGHWCPRGEEDRHRDDGDAAQESELEDGDRLLALLSMEPGQDQGDRESHHDQDQDSLLNEQRESQGLGESVEGLECHEGAGDVRQTPLGQPAFSDPVPDRRHVGDEVVRGRGATSQRLQPRGMMPRGACSSGSSRTSRTAPSLKAPTKVVPRPMAVACK